MDKASYKAIAELTEHKLSQYQNSEDFTYRSQHWMGVECLLELWRVDFEATFNPISKTADEYIELFEKERVPFSEWLDYYGDSSMKSLRQMYSNLNFYKFLCAQKAPLIDKCKELFLEDAPEIDEWVEVTK